MAGGAVKEGPWFGGNQESDQCKQGYEQGDPYPVPLEGDLPLRGSR